MKAQRVAAVFAALTIAGTGVSGALAAKAPATWDDLVLVQSKKLQRVYLLPGADFRGYTKVMLDPTEVAFRKNWVRDYNSSQRNLGAQLNEKDAERIKQEVSTGFGDIFTKAYSAAGYQVVQSPGPDVLRVRTGVLNLSIAAPDVLTAGRSRTFSSDAGEATLVVEARDSQSGALLGRALDRKTAGDSRPYLRNSVTNRSDFSRMFTSWAKASVEGLQKLKALSPVQGATVAER